MYEEPEIGMTRLDGKGRIVIPKNVRRRAGLSENTVLLAVGCDKMLFLKKGDIREMHIFDDIGGLALAGLCPSGERVGVREVLIRSLANQSTMTCMKLYSAVKRLRAGVSYQAVWKMLQNLVEQQQIKKVGPKEYAINPQWIRRLKCTCEIVEQRHEALKIDEEVIACQK